MNNYMYYGEVVARISATLHNNEGLRDCINTTIREEKDETYSICSLCADAGRGFEMAEDLCDDYFIDWNSTIECYACEIREQLLNGKVPGLMDLYLLSAKAIEKPFRAHNPS